MSNTGRSKRVLVTGGAGFIGSHLIELLTTQGHSITIVDDLSTGSRNNLNNVNPAQLTIIEDTVANAIPRLIDDQPFDAVYHLAAAVGVRLILDKPTQTIETNVVDTAALLHLAVQQNAPTLIASSSEVYGKTTHIPFAEDDDVLYGPTVYSRWSYACTKAIDEYLALAAHREHNLPVVPVRFFNTVGPRQIGDYGMVLPRFVEAALAGRPLTVYGDGTQSRCFCDVRDVVQVLPPLLDRPSCWGRVFNVGSDDLITIADLARIVIDVLDSSSKIEFIGYDEAYESGFEDLAARQPDLTRLRAETDFTPQFPLAQTIRDLADEIGKDVSGKAETAKPVRGDGG